MTWHLTLPEAETLAAAIRMQPGWVVVRIAPMCGGNYSVECGDPEGNPRYMHSQAEWNFQIRGIHASYAQLCEETPVRPVLGTTQPRASKVKQTRVPAGQLPLIGG